jgi:hypothetical protein
VTAKEDATLDLRAHGFGRQLQSQLIAFRAAA